jgi:hypothetical protein
MGALHRITVFALAVASIVVAGGAIDYIRTTHRDPGPVAACRTPATQPECRAASEDRRAEIKRLERDFRHREAVYALIVMVALAIAIVGETNARPAKAEKRRAFSAFGVLGVGGLALAGLGLAFASQSTIDPSPWPLFGPGLLMVAVAALGGALTYPYPEAGVPVAAAEGPIHPVQPPGGHAWLGQLAGRVAVAGLVLTAITFMLAVVYYDNRPACGGDDRSVAPGWTDTLANVVALASLIGIGAGLTGLLARRWFVALLCIGGNLAAWVYIIAGSCAGY